MKIATIIVRVLLGLLFLFASISYFFMTTPPPIPEGPMKTFNDGLAASGYMMNLVKIIELVCGIAFVTGFFVPLANIVILPISVNIFLIHAFLSPAELPIAVGVLLANLFLIYAYRDRYAALFTAR